MLNSKRLVLAHFWLAFVVFGLALLLGAWQMFIRSPLHAPIGIARTRNRMKAMRAMPSLYRRPPIARGTMV